MQFFVGTSDYSVPEWRGTFYPEKLSAKKMLGYYSERFSSVEVNYTFRRIPTSQNVNSWAEQVPESFRFSLKAPQLFTHIKRLQGIDDEARSFIATALELGDRLGPILFQLPPTFQKDLPRLDAFLKAVGKQAKIAFEFRHESWTSQDVNDCLHSHSCALCVADTDEIPIDRVTSTTKWGYVRLRRDNYTDAELRKWVKQVKAQKWDKAYVYFKHEDSGKGPKLAARFIELAN